MQYKLKIAVRPEGVTNYNPLEFIAFSDSAEEDRFRRHCQDWEPEKVSEYLEFVQMQKHGGYEQLVELVKSCSIPLSRAVIIVVPVDDDELMDKILSALEGRVSFE